MENKVRPAIAWLLEEGSTFDIVPAIPTGQNFASTMLRVYINNRHSETTSLIAKVAPSSESLRAVFPLRYMYEKEGFFYEHVFPTLELLQNEHQASDQFKAYPRFLKAHWEELNEVFVFEDLKNLQYTSPDQLKPLNYDHCLLVVKEYAKLHGVSYALKKLKPEVFEKLCQNAHDKVFQTLSLTEIKKKQINEKIVRALESLDPSEHREAHERFSKFTSSMFYGVKDALKTETSGEYAVFCHSDCWIGNYLFKYKDGVPEKLCIVDWQLAHCGSPGLDLTYFFFCCTDQELRRKHYDELLQVYYSTLSSFLQQFRCDVNELLPFHVLKDHLRRFSVYAVYMATSVLNLTLITGESTPSLQNATTESEINQLKKSADAKDLELYNSRMRGLILDFIDYGYDL